MGDDRRTGLVPIDPGDHGEGLAIAGSQRPAISVTAGGRVALVPVGGGWRIDAPTGADRRRVEDALRSVVPGLVPIDPAFHDRG